MKKPIVLILIAFVFAACNKKNDVQCTPATAESESAEIAAFCNSLGIIYTIDTNGIHYQVVDQGSGVTPNLNSVITVTYTTSSLSGNIIEDNTANPVTKSLNEFIEGWRIALPYIQSGGRIKIVVPSSLAYGCTGITNIIAPNSPLYYDVVLINVE